MDHVNTQPSAPARLAPYAAREENSRGRQYPEEEHPLRGPYQRDRERIIHSTAFRRLEYKTQVFVNHEGDHYRTRLTHTIEVAQIARAIARILRLNEDLTEAVALAHDLGHTPFGHSGEDALRELMAQHGGFEHNRHGIRVVDVLECRYPDFPGLNLTYEVRECIAKHVTEYDHPAGHAFNPDQRQPMEGQVVELADSIAYASHDLDDALGAGILDRSAYDHVPILAEMRGRVHARHPALTPRQERNEIVRSLINLFVTALCENTRARAEVLKISSLDDVRRAPDNIVALPPDISARQQELRQYLLEHVYKHYRVVRMTTKAKRFITDVFLAYVTDRRQLPPYYQRWVEREGLHQGVCDYVAGMTDRYAQDEWQRLFEPFERV